MIRIKILKLVLLFQGLYYSLTAIWAIVSLESFSRITQHFGDPFEMYSIAGLALALGLFFLFSSRREELLRPVGFLALGSAIAVIIPEIIFLPREGNPPLFWADFVEEVLVAVILAGALFKGRNKFPNN